MKTLTQFLEERLLTPAFNITRVSMPQIHDQDSFKKHLDQKGISYIQSFTNIENVKPIQIDIDQDKVSSIDPTLPGKPIIVSDAYYILDGHHRFFAHIENNLDQIEVLYVDETINRLLATANEFVEMNNDD